MPKTILKSPNLSGGLSTQPPQVRFPNQVNQALNASFSVFDGANKRPGTVHLTAPEDMASDGNYRMHAIVRDATAKFLVIFGSDPKIRVFRASNGDELDVTISAKAEAYMSDQGATAADFRVITVTDHSFIVNTRVPTKGKVSPTYALTNTYADFDAMLAASPANGTYNKTTGDTPAQPRGYFLVAAATAGSTVPQWVGPNVTESNSIPPWNASYSGFIYTTGFKMTVNDGASNFTFDFRTTRTSHTNMEDVAADLTANQSPAPAPGQSIRVGWTGGSFYINLPLGWTFVSFETVSTYTSNGITVWNSNYAGGAFEYWAGTIGTTTVGAYGDKNYTRVPPSNQENAVIDETSMPIKLVHNANDSFTADVIDWGFRGTGDELTNPLPSIIAKNLPISDLAFHRDRLVFSGDEHLVFSQSGSIYDLYLGDDRNIVESDPIDVQISGSRVSKIRYIVPFGKRLVFDTEVHQQFELTDADKLTYETVAITPTTQIESTQTRPLPIGLSLFIMGNTADARQMMEYVYDDIRAGSDASDVGEHVKGLLPEEVRSLVGSSNARVVLAVQGDGPRIMAYSFFWNGNQKQQAAWGLWELVGDAAIHDAAGIGTDAFLLVARGDGMVIEKLPMSSFTDAGETPIHMDRQYTIDPGGDAAGVYTNDGYTTWEAPTVDGGWDTAVLVGSEWGTDENRVLPLKRNVADANNEVFTFGRFNVAGGKVVLGQAYTMRLEVSRPFRRDQTGQAILGEKLNAMRWVVEVRRTSDLSLKSVDDSTSHLAREVRFVKETPSDGRIQAWFGGDVDRMKLVIESAGPKPATVTGWELEAMTGRR